MDSQEFNLVGKVAVVTGASRGIGKAVVSELLFNGCIVVAIARQSEAFTGVVNEWKSQNYNLHANTCDLSDEVAIRDLIKTITDQFHRIDILVNCAGVGKLGPISDLTDEELTAPIKVPLLAAILLSRGLLPSMIDRGESRIINLISPASYFDLPYMASYTASRSGLLSFSRALDEEVRHQGIRVRTVCPTWVDTEYLAKNDSSGDWFPKVSKYFPTISDSKAADYVIQAIKCNKREIKPSILLRLFEFNYRWFPRLSVAVFKLLGVYSPIALAVSKKNTQEGDRWTNWEESIDLKAHVAVFPENEKQVADIVVNTLNYPTPLRAAGSRHTTTHCGVADHGTLMVMRNMDKILDINIENRTVTTQAGALYIDVANELRKAGLQFYVNVEIGNLTMGSAASTGTKDASMPSEYGQVCSYCIGVKIVLADGEIRTITNADAELMSMIRSSYGLLGVITQVTFKVKPIQAMQVRHQSFSLNTFEQALPDLKKSDESMMYYLFPFQNKLTVEFRKYHQANDQNYNHWLWKIRNLCWKTIAPIWGNLATRYIQNKRIRYFLIDKFYDLVTLIVCKLLKNPATVATDQIIRYPEHKNIAKYTFSIWAFPEDEIMPIMKAYYKFCQDYYNQHGFRCDMLNVGYRILEDKNPIFSYSYNGTVMTLDPVTTGAPGWDDFLKAYNEFCSANNGVPLFNQSKWLTRNQVQKAFTDRIGIFWQARTKLDIDDRFLNTYFRELFEPN